jgi:hypothetical protein
MPLLVPQVLVFGTVTELLEVPPRMRDDVLTSSCHDLLKGSMFIQESVAALKADGLPHEIGV